MALLSFVLLLSSWSFATAQADDGVQELHTFVEMVQQNLPGGALHFVRDRKSGNCKDEEGQEYADEESLRTRKTKQAHGLKKTLDEAEAKSLFELISKQKDIPFELNQDGCYARAHEIARILELNGVESKKLFISGVLIAESKFSRTGKVRWNYHVAPSIWVKTASGLVEERVIDPSLLDHLGTLTEWQQKMGQGPCSDVEEGQVPPDPTAHCALIRTDRFTFSPQDIRRKPKEWEKASLEKTEEVLRAYHEALAARSGRSGPSPVGYAPRPLPLRRLFGDPGPSPSPSP